jgi:glycosyltransferase involved in cell wall biosynthesis
LVVLVIPAFARDSRDAAWLSRCVASALSQVGLDRIVVVDDASPQQLPPLPGATLLRHPQNLGPAAARNTGLVRALEEGARLVLFTDLDCVLEPGWARAMAGFLADGAHVAAGGVTRALGTTLLDRYQDFEGALNGRWVLPGRRELLYAPTCNLAVRAEALSAVRFDERFPTSAGEDFDFCYRLRRLGTIGLNPAAIVRHDFGYQDALRGYPRFVRQFRRYGEAAPLVFEKHPELDGLPAEACAPPDPRAPPPTDPGAYGRPSLSRLGPGAFQLAMVLLRQAARAAFRRGRRHGGEWRELRPAPSAAAAHHLDLG